MEQLYIWIITWLLSWVITFLVTFLTTRASLQQEIFKTKYDYDKRLLEERLKYYPELFEITQEIWKKKYWEENLKIIPVAKEKFLAWRNKWTWYLLLTKNSLEAYNLLKEALKANPWDWKKWYTKEQLEKIYKLRNSLRWALKDDVWIKISDYKD